MACMSEAALAWPAPLQHIDWHQPWLAPYAAHGQPCAQAVLRGVPVWQALSQRVPPCAPGDPEAPTFVDHADLPADQAYEAYIYQTRRVPTRCGAHDFFNGLMWLNWPRTKAALNQRQWQAIEAAGGVGHTRGTTRDALTLLDENGGILLAHPAIWEALRHRQWHTALVELRPLWAQAQLFIIGHALLEQLLLYPRKSLTAHVWLPTPPVQDWAAQALVQAKPSAAPVGEQIDLAQLDAVLAQALLQDDFGQGDGLEACAPSKPFTPLPVMGTPGWCADNAHAAFYDDPQVFRVLRAHQNPPQRVAPIDKH
jgi:hypothetical protein